MAQPRPLRGGGVDVASRDAAAAPSAGPRSVVPATGTGAAADHEARGAEAAGGVVVPLRGTLDDGYRLLFEANPAPMWVYDAETFRFLEVNPAAIAHYGYTRSDFLAMRVTDLQPTASAAEEDASPSAAGGRPPEEPDRPGICRHRRNDGSVIHVEINRSPVTFSGRSAELVLARDITVELQLGQQLRESEDILREAQQLAHLGRWEWDIQRNDVRWSDELFEIYGLSPQSFQPTYEGYLARVHPDDRPQAISLISETIRTGRPFSADYRIVLPGGGIRWLHSRGRLVRSEQGDRMLGICQDITAQKETEEALTRLALHDSLTGLCNRALLVDRLDAALSRVGRRSARIAVLFIDLDRFKAVNDTLGHAAGDELLVVVGNRLRQVLRPGDTIARLGGDEFAVVCENVEDERAARDVAARILNALALPIHLEGQEVMTSASIGVALSGEPGATADTLLRDADTAMYEAKEAGRHRIAVFDPAIRAENLARAMRSEELRQALERGELRIYYQPEIDLAGERFTGVEALVRWEHPALGLLSPADFIDVAEETGLVVALGEAVLRGACRELAVRRALPGQENLSLSVNLSARQLVAGGLVETVRDVLDETGLDPGRLCLEITESVLMEEVGTSIDALLGLKALGVRLAIDDFGTGYSSLSYLRRFPVDAVKLDRSFVAGLGVDPAATAIVSAVVNLSHALGLRVVAEGVETEEQLVALRALRCDRAQGYYWSRPLPAAELPSWQRELCVEPLAASPIDVHAVLVESTTEFRATTRRTVVLQAPPNLAHAFGELTALRSVVGHLLANAAKYSDDDRPIVVSAAGDRRWVRVSVADFGVGMTAEEAVRCFEQFWQADSAGEGRHRGTGIGLYIVRSLVEAMGGHVAVKTAPGRGSTFTFALPRSARIAERVRNRPASGLGEDSSIREFMRQIGVPGRRGL